MIRVAFSCDAYTHKKSTHMFILQVEIEVIKVISFVTCFPQRKLGWLWIDTGWIRGKFQFKTKSQSIHSSLLWINKTSSHTKLSSASCLLLAANTWRCRMLLMRKWLDFFVLNQDDSRFYIICCIFTPPALIHGSHLREDLICPNWLLMHSGRLIFMHLRAGGILELYFTRFPLKCLGGPKTTLSSC